MDLGSADEIGMLPSPYRPTEKVDIKVSSSKILPLVTNSTVSYVASENTTNGLFACDHII
jgi:hypothetical protein